MLTTPRLPEVEDTAKTREKGELTKRIRTSFFQRPCDLSEQQFPFVLCCDGKPCPRRHENVCFSTAGLLVLQPGYFKKAPTCLLARRWILSRGLQEPSSRMIWSRLGSSRELDRINSLKSTLPEPCFCNSVEATAPMAALAPHLARESANARKYRSLRGLRVTGNQPGHLAASGLGFFPCKALGSSWERTLPHFSWLFIGC